MKRLGIILFAFVLLTALFLLAPRAFASEGEVSVVAQDDGYSVLCNDTLIRSFSGINEALAYAAEMGSSIRVDSVRVSEDVSLPGGEYSLLGALVTEGSFLITEDAKVILNASIAASDGVFIRGGEAKLIGGVIRATVNLDGYSSSYFRMEGGEIVSNSAKGALVIEIGSAEIAGGYIRNENGNAVVNYSTLSLGGAAIIEGASADLLTTRPVSLSVNGGALLSVISCEIGFIPKEGEITPIFYNASGVEPSGIRLIDANGVEHGLKYMNALQGCPYSALMVVSKPYSVEFYINQDNIYKHEYYNGECVRAPEMAIEEGFTVEGWYLDRDFLQKYSFGEEVNCSHRVFAKLALSPLFYNINGINTEYDGEDHILSFSELYHPLPGSYSFRWLNDAGEVVSLSKSLSLERVDESGVYSCEITFSYNGYTSFLVVEDIEVIIDKRTVKPPDNIRTEYCGLPITPSIPKSSLYYAAQSSYTDVGVYKIALTLLDGENNCWDGISGDVAYLSFEIYKAKNEWIEGLEIEDIYLGESPRPKALAKYGEVKYFYSIAPQGEYSEALPSLAGAYYVKAVIPESENYYGAESVPMRFLVLEDEPLYMSIKSYPSRMSYTAFDTLDRDGLLILVKYKSGREAELDGYGVAVRYQSAESFRSRDSVVFLEYRGLTLPMPITVSRASYGVSFSIPEREVIYNGSHQSIAVELPMPVGLDGIGLRYTVMGGGKNVGRYDISIIFSTDSEEYLTPEPIYTSINILPYTVEPYFAVGEYIYDGTAKCPEGFYYNLDGARVELSMSGAQTMAGEGYIAKAFVDDGNYILSRDAVEFTIARADYDLSGVCWSDGALKYNGESQGVRVSGLPKGITILGYTGGEGINAGEYSARVSLAFDERNYNPPIIAEYKWRIIPAEYDMSGIKLLGGEFVYDGNYHYPQIQGELPIGLDGIRLEARIREGVKDVTDGCVGVLVEFCTESKNYNTPLGMTVEISVLPRGIVAIWDNSDLIYNGSLQTPLAWAGECLLEVKGGGIDAGEYIAIATSLDKNYVVSNDKIKFEIKKAENYWVKSPSCGDIFFGAEPSPEGEAFFGICEFDFYVDQGLSVRAELPLKVGEYYFVASVEEGINHYSLSSSPIRFSVIQVVPIGLNFIFKSAPIALTPLLPKDFECIINYNDGTEKIVNGNLVEIIYEYGESPRVQDSFITVKCLGLSSKIPLSVLPLTLDLSAAAWGGLIHTYDGRAKLPSLSGLPEYVHLIGFEGGEMIRAGEYKVSPIFDYDRDNILLKNIPMAVMKIEKCPITPSLSRAEYNGGIIKPISSDERYYPISQGFRAAGEYLVPVALVDNDNYYLTSEKAVFVIEPKIVEIAINDVELFLFERIENIEYSILTELGELEIELEYYGKGEYIYASCSDDSISLSVTPGRVTRVFALSPRIRRAVYISFALFVIFALGLIIIIRRRERVLAILFGGRREIDSPTPTPRLGCGYLSIDLPHAEDMITDPIARTLIRKEAESITTDGTRRAYINVDTLCAHFEPGDRVDINDMKKKGLIASDAFTVKVLGRGVMDRPLFIFANSFSLSAVKMIALTGGEAHKVLSQRGENSK